MRWLIHTGNFIHDFAAGCEFLLPALGPGYVVIMDNAAFHKSEQTKLLIKNAGCQLLFIAPYSPDLNPIEKFWGNLKAKIKRKIKSFSTLAQAVEEDYKCDQLSFN
jgi:transposase